MKTTTIHGRLGRQAAAWGLAVLLIATVGCGGSNAASPDPESDERDSDKPPVVVRAATAELRTIAQTVTALGRCEPLPQKTSLLTPIIEGQVRELLSQQGTVVSAAQPIVSLDTTLAQAALAEKVAARQALEKSRRLLESLPREPEQQASKLAIEQAKIAVVRASAIVEQLRPLRSRGEVSLQQYFEAEQALKQANIQQQTAEAQYEVLMLKPRPEAIAEAQAKIEAADAAVKSAQAQLDLHTIRSPIDGVLDSLTCRIGQTVAVGATIGQVVDDRRILAAVWVPVARGHSIRVGQTARVHSGNSSRSSVDADKNAKATAGSVSYVGRVADPQTANIPVHVLVENEHHAFVVGQTISATITTSELPETLSVPRAAIHDEGEGPVITTIRDGKAVVLHPQLGAADSGWIAVSGADLKPGEQVIVEGAYNLPDGTPVEVKTAAPEEK